MDQRLSLITLGVRDLTASRAFYRRLGWVESSASNEHVAFFQIGCMAFALFGWDSLAEDARVPAETSGFRGVTLALNARSREEADRYHAEMVAAGATAVKPMQDTPWGGYSGYVADPDGHLFEIAHNPFWGIDATGAVILPA